LDTGALLLLYRLGADADISLSFFPLLALDIKVEGFLNLIGRRGRPMLYQEVVSGILTEIYEARDIFFCIFRLERTLDILSVFGGASLSFEWLLISGGALNLVVCRVDILEVLSIVETVSATSADHELVVHW
jgi:hypothetical protein